MAVTALSRLEVWTCIAFVSVVASYCMFSTYLATQQFCREYATACDLRPGLWFTDRAVNRPAEWTIQIRDIVTPLIPWWIAHLVGAEVTRKHCHTYLPMWYILIGSVYNTTRYGIASTAFLILFSTAFLLFSRLNSKLLMWTAGSAALHYAYSITKAWNDWCGTSLRHLDVEGGTLAWTGLRCIAYNSEKIDSGQRINKQDLVNYFAYIFYLPLLYSGPIINYDKFILGMSQTYKPWTLRRLALSCLNILRFSWWILFTDIAFHFIYFASMQKHTQIVLGLDNWALYGLAWCLGLYFMLVYVASYGLSSAVGNMEQMPVPAHPACVARISLYSNMWRYFDRGLYLYMVKYIYVPCIENRKGFLWRLFGTAACFFFIFVYHGLVDYIVVWIVVNFLEVSLEGVGKSIASTAAYQRWESRHFSPRNARRFYALLACPLMAASALSNMYFIGGSMQLGDAFTERLLTDGWRVNLLALSVCYCVSQTALEYQRHVEQKRMTRDKSE